ncbi:LytR/AlgR family response regulator transcription factor [Larkinella ripae]
MFLLLFQPFGLNLWQTSFKTAKILGFGLISFLVTAGLNFLTPVLLPGQFTNERWTVGREILWITLHITLIGLVNSFYLQLLIGNAIHAPDLAGTIIVTFLIGIFPSAATVIVNYIIRLKKYSESARAIPVPDHPAQNPPAADRPDVPDPQKPAQPLLTLTAENEKDSLSFPGADLFYIESSDNYSTVVYQKDGQILKPLLRSSLSRLENQLEENENAATVRQVIVRCHRSYLVNLEKVEKVTGNAQGYKLHLYGGQFQIPVARKYNDTLVARLKALP